MRYSGANFSGDPVILEKIASFIIAQGWEISGSVVHTGNNNYEIDFTKEPAAFLAGCGYRGKFWVRENRVHHKEEILWMA